LFLAQIAVTKFNDMRFLMILAAIAAFFTSCARQKGPEKQDNNNTLLWEVTGNGLTKPSYFFGTMHILCSEDAIISPGLQSVINQVGQVYLEVDMDDMTQMFSIMSAMNMTDGKKLSDFYTPEEYEKVKGWFEKHGQLPFAMLERYKPMMLSSMIETQAMSCPEQDGMEMRIMSAAADRKLEIKGLETMAFQAGMIDSIPYEDQAKELLQAIDSVQTQRKMMAVLVREYKMQNLDSIEALTTSEEGGMDKYLDMMLYNRNRNWIKQFPAIAKEKSTLFAVGAGHLPGKNGVLNLLRQAGFTVKPLVNNTTTRKA
jgi:uncharacterized protein YbaP (TraB family)